MDNKQTVAVSAPVDVAEISGQLDVAEISDPVDIVYLAERSGIMYITLPRAPAPVGTADATIDPPKEPADLPATVSETRASRDLTLVQSLIASFARFNPLPHLTLLDWLGMGLVLAGAIGVGMFRSTNHLHRSEALFALVVTAIIFLAIFRATDPQRQTGTVPISVLMVVMTVIGSFVGLRAGLLIAPYQVSAPPAAQATATSIGSLFGTQYDQPASVHDYAYAPDGRAIATSAPHGIRIIDVQTEQVTRNLTVPYASAGGLVINAIAWDSHTQRLAASYSILFPDKSADQGLIVWNPDGAIGFTTPLDSVATEIAWSPDGHILAASMRPLSADIPGTIAQWSAVDWQPRTTIFTLGIPTNAWETANFAWSTDSRLLAIINNQRSVVIVTADTPAVVERFDDTAPILALNWSPDGRYLALGHADGSLTLFDLRQNTGTRVVLAIKDPLTQIQWSGDSRRLLVVTGSQIAILSVISHQVLGIFSRPAASHLRTPVVPTPTVGASKAHVTSAPPAGKPTDTQVVAAHWSPDGTQVSALFADGLLVLWPAPF